MAGDQQCSRPVNEGRSRLTLLEQRLPEPGLSFDETLAANGTPTVNSIDFVYNGGPLLFEAAAVEAGGCKYSTCWTSFFLLAA